MTDQDINRAVEQSTRNIDRAIDITRRSVTEPARTTGDLLRLVRLPNEDALRLSRSAEIFERTLEALHQQVAEGGFYNITHQGKLHVTFPVFLNAKLLLAVTHCIIEIRVSRASPAFYVTLCNLTFDLLMSLKNCTLLAL